MAESQLKRIGELELAEDIDFERKSWRVQRIAWVIMTLLLVAALLGAFGNGWLSRTQASVAGGALEVDYDRFIRFQAPTELRFRFGPLSLNGDSFGLWVSREYLKSMEVKQITPAPDEEVATGDGNIYIFKASAVNEPVEVLFRFEVQAPGSMDGQFAIANPHEAIGERLSISQWALP